MNLNNFIYLGLTNSTKEPEAGDYFAIKGMYVFRENNQFTFFVMANQQEYFHDEALPNGKIPTKVNSVEGTTKHSEYSIVLEAFKDTRGYLISKGRI